MSNFGALRFDFDSLDGLMEVNSYNVKMSNESRGIEGRYGVQ